MHAFRPFLPRSLSLLLSLSVFLPLSVTPATAASAPSRPNLLIIQTDEHNFRTLGCYPLSGAIESDAATLPAIIKEMLQATQSERQGRVIDHDGAGSMEEKKKEGYF